MLHLILTLMLAPLALAQEPAQAEAVDTTKLVGPVVVGQDVHVEGARGAPPRTFRVDQTYWLIRDDAVRTALANAKTVPRLEEALVLCRDASIACGIQSASAWATMREQFSADTQQMDALLVQTAKLTAALDLAEHDRDRFRRQRNTTWGVVGVVAVAVLVGTGVGLGVSVAGP